MFAPVMIPCDSNSYQLQRQKGGAEWDGEGGMVIVTYALWWCSQFLTYCPLSVALERVKADYRANPRRP